MPQSSEFQQAPRKSDTFAVTESGQKVRVQRGELPAGSFQIAGVDLASNQDVLDQAARILGHVATSRTGDASDSEETACYRSARRDDPTVLLFGKGEVDYSFELTSRGALRKKTGRCLPSVKVSRSMATVSGLRLGETPDQVIAHLGLPTRRVHEKRLGRTVLFYDFDTTKKTSPRDLARFRRQNPGTSEYEFEENFGSYNLAESIRATFERGSLTGLWVDWSAQY